MTTPPRDFPPRPVPRPRPVARPAAPKVPWGWIEGAILWQSLLPALLFLPGVTAVRPLTRISSYLLGLGVWALVYQKGRSTPAGASFPARPWLVFCSLWLVLSMGHPNIYSLPAALGQVGLYLAILSPAFWAGESLSSPRQLNRIMAVLFLCNALSASVGMAQVFSDRFNPPVIPVASGVYSGDSFKIEVQGRLIFRPCGLSDSPGAAAPAGATTALIGLCFALRPIGLLRRLACAALAFVGVAVIYYTQVRSTLLVLSICFLALTALLAAQGRVGSALSLAAGSGLMVVGALFWVARRMGGAVFDRFASLLTDLLNQVQKNRGEFVWDALTRTVWESPMGYGMGWWGMIYVTFFDPARVSLVWVEVMIQAWVVDGGIPLLIGYGGAVVVAALNSARIALGSGDREVAFWGAVVAAQNVSTVALCFSYVPFLSPIGFQFWLLNAAVHAADVRSRALARGPAAPAEASRPRARVRRPWPPGRAAS